MKKKLLSIMLVMIMMCSTIPAFTTIARVPGNATVTVGSQVVSQGSGTVDVNIPVTLSGTTDVCGAQLAFTYTEGITLKRVTEGSALQDGDMTFTRSVDMTQKPYILLWDGWPAKTSGTNGLMATLTFSVPVNTARTFNVNVDVRELYHGDNALTDYNVTVVNGTIQVVGNGSPTTAPTAVPTTKPTTPTENPTDVPMLPTDVPTAAPSTGQRVMNHGDYIYNQSGTTTTDTGYKFTAAAGDFDARIWVNGCPVGNAVASGGVTISFKAVMPQTNEGRVYYTYSGDQNVVGQNYCFFGLKPVTGGYKILKNMSHEDSTDEFYTNKVYTGTIAFMLYIEKNHFDVYANGEWIGEGTPNADLSTRWYYAFISYYSGNKNVKMEVKDIVYLKGGTSGNMPTTAPTTTPTAVPTTKPTTPTLTVSNAYAAADGSNGIYYVIDIVNRVGNTLENLAVAHCPDGVKERYADTKEYALNLSGNITARLISILRGIPEAQKDRIIHTWVDLDYRDANGTHTLSAEREASLSGARGN